MIGNALLFLAHRWPRTTYAWMSRYMPMFKIPGQRIWLIGRHDLIEQVLRSNQDYSSELRKANPSIPQYNDTRTNKWLTQSSGSLPSVRTVVDTMMLFVEDDTHQRQRSMVQSYFTRSRLKQLQAQIETRADRLVRTTIEKSSTFDAVESIAYPFPVAVIADMFGLDPKDHPQLRTWSDRLAIILDPALPATKRAPYVPSFFEFSSFLLKTLEQRAQNPKDDLLTAIAQNETLNKDEKLALIMLLFSAGHETTTNWLGSILYHHQRWWSQVKQSQDDPQMIRAAIWETLRYAPPVQLTLRTALKDSEFNGHKIQAGDALILHVGAASMDARVYQNPKRFRLNRSKPFRLAFGHGVHYCVGAVLAEMEAMAITNTFLWHVEQIKICKAKQKPSSFLKGYASLEIEVRPCSNKITLPQTTHR